MILSLTVRRWKNSVALLLWIWLQIHSNLCLFHLLLCTWGQLILIFLVFCIYEFAFLTVCYLWHQNQYSRCFLVICRHAQCGKRFELSAQHVLSWGWTRWYFLLLSSHIVSKCSFCSLFSATLNIFQIFVLFFQIFVLVTCCLRWPPSVVLKCCLVLLCTRRWWCTLWRKSVC